MLENKLNAQVRKISPFAAVIDLRGEMTSFSETTLAEAYAAAISEGVTTVILNFSQVDYLNSLGVGMLVSQTVRAHRENKRLVAYGLSDHYRRIFSLTRLDEVVPLYESEQVALAQSEPMDRPEREY